MQSTQAVFQKPLKSLSAIDKVALIKALLKVKFELGGVQVVNESLQKNNSSSPSFSLQSQLKENLLHNLFSDI